MREDHEDTLQYIFKASSSPKPKGRFSTTLHPAPEQTEEAEAKGAGLGVYRSGDLKDKEEFSRWIRRLENERLKERDVRCLRVIKNTDIWGDESSL